MSTRSWAFFDQLRSVVNRKQTAVKYYCIFDHLSSAMMMDDLGEHSTLHSVPTSAVHPVYISSLPAISHSSSSCIPRNLLTTLATSETISLFLSPPAGEARRGEIHTSAYTKNVLAKVSISHNGFNDGIFGRTAARTRTRTRTTTRAGTGTETGQQRERRGE